MGHRGFVGGKNVELWYGIGMLQYHFLISQGIKPSSRFLDLGCGALRLGQYLIPFLEAGNYYGLDAEPNLIRAGLSVEIPSDIVDMKSPVFTVNHTFDFSFIDYFEYSIAQSLFTHLTLQDIERCFEKLKAVARTDSKFFFTFFEGDSSNNKYEVSHANRRWDYSYQELTDVAEKHEWKLSYIGDWKHPRDQKMVEASLIS